MKKIVAINASPRPQWNTAQLIRSAADGLAADGAEVEVIDLYKLEPFMGCRSCFACKMERNYGVCIFNDGLKDVLAKIRAADGLILGTPNYFGRPSAGFRALFERLCFQYLTYRTDRASCNERPIPVLFIMTSNAPAEMYDQLGYSAMVAENTGPLEAFIGPVTTFISGNTLQVSNYDRFDWTYFDIPGKIERHEKVFPQELEQVRTLARELFA